LNPTKNPTTSASLAFLIEEHAGLEAVCDHNHAKEYDMDRLVRRFGPAATVAELEALLPPCPECGAPRRLETIAKYLRPIC
jgi:hypothetical protein